VMAVALSLIAALVNFSREQAKITADSRPNSEVIDSYRDRFRGLRAILPKQQLMGYVSDLEASDPRYFSTLLAAQYALAPHILAETLNREALRTAGYMLLPERLVETSDCSWVVGNLTNSLTDSGELARRYRLRLVRDFGKGVVLYRTAR